ncbi:MAG: cysteine desulfurase family protein [Eubacteriales bacterium]
MKIYFDNAATTKAFDEVCDTLLWMMKDEYYNPSSPYSAAINTDKKLNESRDIILKSLNMKGRLIFTSGGSESNNLAIKGGLKKLRNAKIITSDTEHPSVKHTCAQAAKENNSELIILPVDKMGYVDKDALYDACKDTESALVSIMHVNNETGTIQPIEELAHIAKQNIKNCVFHSDGVQAFLKAESLGKNSNIDMYTISSHKIHGPKGVGALYVKNANLIEAMTQGGGQEDNLRSGTYNTPSIVAFAKAVEIVTKNHNKYIKTMYDIKKTIINMLDASDIDYTLCSDKIDKTAPHILNIAFRDIMGEVLLSAMDSSGLIANTGSACSSKKTVVSPVLKSMGVDEKYIKGAIRLSFGAYSTVEEAQSAAKIIIENVARLRRFKRA